MFIKVLSHTITCLYNFVLTLSGRAFKGALARGREGMGAESACGATNFETIHGIEMKFGQLVKNHELINLV